MPDGDRIDTSWSKLGSTVTVVSLSIGLVLNVTFGVWYMSELFYRVSMAEGKLQAIEIRLNEDQKLLASAINTEIKISTQLDGLKDLLDRMITREESLARDKAYPHN